MLKYIAYLIRRQSSIESDGIFSLSLKAFLRCVFIKFQAIFPMCTLAANIVYIFGLDRKAIDNKNY